MMLQACEHAFEETVREVRFFHHEELGRILRCTRCGCVIPLSMWGDEVMMLDDEEDQTRC